MFNVEEKIGQEKGNFKITKYLGKFNEREYHYEFACKFCGKTRKGRWGAWNRGCYKALCECQKELGNKHHAWKGCGELSQNYFRRYYHSSAKRGLEFSITIEYAWKIYQQQKGRCALSGWNIKLEQNYDKRHQQTASIDRIDSSKGYIEGNIQWIHRDINYLKCNCDSFYFLEICNAIAKTNPLKLDKKKDRKINYFKCKKDNKPD